jgi:saccharopine dehydrogenase (NAD+, L-lysine-forming)
MDKIGLTASSDAVLGKIGWIDHFNAIFLRAEGVLHEYRTPLVPDDIPALIQQGFFVCVQSSRNRVFSDEDYEDAGALITQLEWYETRHLLDPRTTLIIGLKEIDLSELDGHHHMYFSHSFKSQRGATSTLNAFHSTASTLWDMEYFQSEISGRRSMSFGFYAGMAGCLLGLLQCFKGLHWPLAPWTSYEEALLQVHGQLFGSTTTFEIAMVGHGECGRGVRRVLEDLGLSAVTIGRNDEKTGRFDLVINCIQLDGSNNELWTDLNAKTIVDVSCDVAKCNHPFRHLYNEETTWENPVRHLVTAGGVDVICISNLPSLLPRESSVYFSKQCVSTIMLPLEKNDVWQKCHDAYSIFSL